MNNPYKKLPNDLHYHIDEEVERRIEEFYQKNTTIEAKLTEEEKEKLEDWILAITTYEYYRHYNITEKELEEYYKENKIELKEELPRFRDLIK